MEFTLKSGLFCTMKIKNYKIACMSINGYPIFKVPFLHTMYGLMEPPKLIQKTKQYNINYSDTI